MKRGDLLVTPSKTALLAPLVCFPALSQSFVKIPRVQARDRPEHQQDNSAVESPPRVLDVSGSSHGSINTSLESTPLVPTPRRMSTPAVSRVLEPLLEPRLTLPTIVGAQLRSSCRRFSLDGGPDGVTSSVRISGRSCWLLRPWHDTVF